MIRNITIGIIITLVGLLLLTSTKTIVQINTTDSAVLTKPTINEKNDIFWKEYRNSKYHFKIEYPSNWYLHEIDGLGLTAFVFYPKKVEDDELVDTFRKNTTLIGVYPNGYASDAFSYTFELSEDREVENSREERNYILDSDSKRVFMKMFFIDNTFENWNDGFVVSRLKVDNLELLCANQSNSGSCDTPEDNTHNTNGTISEEDYTETLDHMLSSFKFIN